MEIKIYLNHESFKHEKVLYCSRVNDPDSFSFESAISVFRSIYGSGVIIVFVCV